LTAAGWIPRTLLCVATITIASGAEVRLSGHVTDKTSAPVSGAKVTLTLLNEGQTFEAESDPTGSFSLLLTTAGEYSISVDRQGYYVYAAPSLRIESTAFELTIALDGVHELRSSIEVSAPKGTFDEKTAPQNTLSSKTLFDIPFPNQNSLRSGLRMLPGLVQDARGGIHLYGSAEEQTHHNFEGFQLNDPLTGRLEARMSLEAVESVDASPGQPGADFGRGVGGTLSIHARKGDDKFRYSATNLFPGIDMQRGTTIGSWTPRGNVSGPWWRGRAWFFNTLELQYVNNLVADLPGGQNRSRSYRANDLLHNQFNLGSADVLTVGLLFNYWFAPRNGLTFLDPRETTVDRRSRQWFGYIKDQKSFHRGALLEIGYAASRTFSREVPQGDSGYIVSDAGRRGSYYANARREASRDQWIVNGYLPSLVWLGTHQLKAGGDFLKLGYSQAVSRTGILFERWDSLPLRSVSFYGSGALAQSNQEGSAYLQDAWRARENLTIELGLRVDRSQILGNWNVSPRFGFAWVPGIPSTRISGGIARVFDYTNLRTFNRPNDQYMASTIYDDSGTASISGLSIYRFPPRRLRSPEAVHWNLGVERTLNKRIAAKAQWLQRFGRSGLSYANILATPQSVADIVDFFGDPAPVFDGVFELTNLRRDSYRSIEVSLQQSLSGEHGWMVSYTRSTTHSNAVVDRNIDDPLIVTNNQGPLPWDAPNRLVNWGFLPTPWKDWSIAYLLESRSGFPFSIQDEKGRVLGAVDDHRFPTFFEWNLFVERRMTIRGYRVGIRAGFINVTAHQNPNVVNNVAGGPSFLQMYGGQRRAVNFRLRFLGRAS
jgi:hypothetical protein